MGYPYEDDYFEFEEEYWKYYKGDLEVFLYKYYQYEDAGQYELEDEGIEKQEMT
jgi:hypothetical protein